MSFRLDDIAVTKDFKKHNSTVNIQYTTYKGKTMRYIASKPLDKNLPTIIFIHGAPGSSSDFFKYLRDADLNAKANLISVDRLGYGYSDYGHAETSITEQAKSILNILTQNKLNQVVVMGWSYGGPIAVKMDVLNHDIIKHIVLIAPAISPKDEKFFALGKVAKWGVTKWMVPKPFRVAEAEKMSHVKELQLMLPDWSQIKTPISYYQGDNDHIVPYANTQFIKTHVSSKFLEVTTIKEGSHFIAFKNYDLIKAKLLQILKNLSKNP